MPGSTVLILIIIGVIAALLTSAIRLLREYERATIFTLGRFSGIKGPGFFPPIPIVQQMVKIDLRTVVRDVTRPGRGLARQRLGQGERGHYLTTLHDISNERTSTLVFPFPVALKSLFFQEDQASGKKDE
jgi:hypothetical protein